MKTKVKSLAAMLVCVLLVCSALAACTTTPSAAPTTAPAATAAPTEEATQQPTAAPAGDDMSKKVQINLFENGWANIALSGEDPFKAFIDSKFNVDFILTNVPSTDLESKLMVQFSSGTQPDIVYSWDKNIIRKLYDQGVLVEDMTPYLDKVPALKATYTKEKTAYASVSGKMIGLPTIPDPPFQQWMIRKDWLQALNLKMPATDTELLDVFRAFAKNDPDKNGKNDTYGITSAGSGVGLGEITSLEAMYGQPGISIQDNKAVNSILNGTHKKFLDFMKTVSDEKLIDPDWLTQGWEQRKAQLFAGKYGMVYYPGVLVQESEAATGNKGTTVNWWDCVGTPKGAEGGGKGMPALLANGMLAISKNAAGDDVKMSRILSVIDFCTYPNEGFWSMRWGKDVLPGRVILDVQGGAKFVNATKTGVRQANPGVDDYGTWIGTRSDMMLEGNADQPGPTDLMQLELQQKAMKVETYTNYEGLLNLDAQAASDAWKVQVEFDMNYILGNATDYDAFMKQWLDAGGQKLMDQAAEQFKAMGLIQ